MVILRNGQRWQPFAQYEILLILLFVFQAANGFPSSILTSSTSKCVQLDVDKEVVVIVEYEAPDISAISPGDEKEKEKDERREFFPGQDMTLLFYKREDGPVEWTSEAPKRKSSTGTRKIRVQIEKKKGDLLFYTGNTAGILEICRQSFKATFDNPRRLSLKISKRAATVQEQLKNMAIDPNSQQEEAIPNKDQSMGILNAETSRISIELNRMLDKMQDLYSQAERSKDRERDFHDKSIRLHGAVRFWPMFRIVAVILAGIVQVRLVVNYMRSRHIY